MTQTTTLERDAQSAFYFFRKRVVIDQAQFVNEFSSDSVESGICLEYSALVDRFLDTNPEFKPCRESLIQLYGGLRFEVIVRPNEIEAVKSQ